MQRVLVAREVYGEFLERLTPLRGGAPRRATRSTRRRRWARVISEAEAERVERAIREAVDGGRDARHGRRARRAPSSRRPSSATSTRRSTISRDELFGPAVALTPVSGIDEAIALANDSDYGLGAGLFTSDLESALRFAREVDCGSIQINWTPLWRADLMPYGGLKGSGIGKEGPRYAIEEMTELKTVVFHRG